MSNPEKPLEQRLNRLNTLPPDCRVIIDGKDIYLPQSALTGLTDVKQLDGVKFLSGIQDWIIGKVLKKAKLRSGAYAHPEFLQSDKEDGNHEEAGYASEIDDVKAYDIQRIDGFKGALSAIFNMTELRDPYISQHQRRVAELSEAIAKEMNLPAEPIYWAAMVHDIGKVGVPSEILSCPKKLSDIELKIMKIHPETGYAIIKKIDAPWLITEMILQHHERENGSGYPNRLAGEDICMGARIIGVADVIEAMASHRPYRAALGINTAIDEISRNRGILYDIDVADAGVKLFREDRFDFSAN